MQECSLFTTPSLAFVVCRLFDDGHSEWCEVISHCDFDLYVFMVLSCMSCLYISEINPLSVVSFAIIFSHSEHCLFTLLIVFFAVQKLLSLIRSHLFTFVFISITLEGGS